MTITTFGSVKYEITDDLRLHVWNVNTDETQNPPFYFQNEHPNGTPWANRQEVEEYFINNFSHFNQQN